MTDKITKLGSSTIQHGKYNDRVYLMKLSRGDYPGIISEIQELAEQQGYTKIFAKVPAWAKSGFEKSGYRTEAAVPRFYNGIDDACFLSKYKAPERGRVDNMEILKNVIETATGTPAENASPLESRYAFSLLNTDDAEALAAVYKAVFETYPFPIHDPAYLRQTMAENIVYFGIRENGRLIAVASCEMDKKSQNVEMTDFATLSEYRKQGFASFLLGKMESEMTKRGILTAYTIARARSYGMNITFAKQGYTYAGTLVKNTNISGGLESMNVWYKQLS